MRKWLYNLLFRPPYPILGVVDTDKRIVTYALSNGAVYIPFPMLDKTVQPGSLVYACDCGEAHMVSTESIKPRFRWKRKCLYNNK